MPSTARTTFALVISVVMLGLGAFVALRPLWAPERPLTSSWWLDGGFALFFLVRGAVGVRIARRRPPPPAAVD